MGVTEIRAMRWWDLDQVVALERRLFPEDSWSAALFWSELAADSWYVVAEQPDTSELAGYAGLAVYGAEAHVQTIAVHPIFQGQGLGRALLTTLVEEATDRGAVELFLEVRADNERAQELYRRAGFVQIGIRPQYYQQSGVDALVMRRGLGQESRERDD